MKKRSASAFFCLALTAFALLTGCGGPAKAGDVSAEKSAVIGAAPPLQSVDGSPQTGQGFTPPKGSRLNKKGQIVDPEGNTFEQNGSWAIPEGGGLNQDGLIVDKDGNLVGGGARPGSQG